MKAKRWYLKFSVHCADICKVNCWLMYRRHVDQLSIQRKSRWLCRASPLKLQTGFCISSNLLIGLLVAGLKEKHWMIVQKDQENVQLPLPK